MHRLQQTSMRRYNLKYQGCFGVGMGVVVESKSQHQVCIILTQQKTNKTISDNKICPNGKKSKF